MAGVLRLAIDQFLKNIPSHSFNINVAAFDTRFAAENHGIGIRILMSVIRYAADRIAYSLTKKGGIPAAKPEGFIVTDKKGPLKKGELEHASRWAKTLVI